MRCCLLPLLALTLGCSHVRTFPRARAHDGALVMPRRAWLAWERAVEERDALEAPSANLVLGDVRCTGLWPFRRCDAALEARPDAVGFRAPEPGPTWAPVYRIRTWDGDWLGVGMQVHERQAVVGTAVRVAADGAIAWDRRVTQSFGPPANGADPCWIRRVDGAPIPEPACEKKAFWAPTVLQLRGVDP